jgi:hypothetical protein
MAVGIDEAAGLKVGPGDADAHAVHRELRVAQLVVRLAQVGGAQRHTLLEFGVQRFSSCSAWRRAEMSMPVPTTMGRPADLDAQTGKQVRAPGGRCGADQFPRSTAGPSRNTVLMRSPRWARSSAREQLQRQQARSSAAAALGDLRNCGSRRSGGPAVDGVEDPGNRLHDGLAHAAFFGDRGLGRVCAGDVVPHRGDEACARAPAPCWQLIQPSRMLPSLWRWRCSKLRLPCSARSWPALRQQLHALRSSLQVEAASCRLNSSRV